MSDLRLSDILACVVLALTGVLVLAGINRTIGRKDAQAVPEIPVSESPVNRLVPIDDRFVPVNSMRIRDTKTGKLYLMVEVRE